MTGSGSGAKLHAKDGVLVTAKPTALNSSNAKCVFTKFLLQFIFALSKKY
jgi:hypothetical protein